MKKFGLSAFKNLAVGSAFAVSSLGMLAAFVACNSDTADVSNGNNNGTEDGGSSSGNTPPTPGDNPPAAPSKTGSITLGQAHTSGIYSVTGLAAFVDATGQTGTGTTATGCEASTEGSCSVLVCDSSQAADGGTVVPEAGAPAAAPNAGTITVSETAEFDIALKGDDSGTYDFFFGSAQVWSPGNEISITAPGATVPALDEKLPAPADVKITAPAWPAPPATLSIKRSEPLNLTWTDGTTGDVTVMFSSVKGTRSATISCKFSADAGEGSVPAAALGKLEQDAQSTISVGSSSTKTVDKSGWSITMTATGSSKSEPGEHATTGTVLTLTD